MQPSKMAETATSRDAAIAVGLQKMRRFMDPKVRALQYLRVMATDKDLAHNLNEDRMRMKKQLPYLMRVPLHLFALMDIHLNM